MELVSGTTASACDRTDFSGAPGASPTSFGMAHRALDRSATAASHRLKEEHVLVRNLDVGETRGSGT
jgi:hypothetical protein